MKRLEGKTALITGGSRGIGAATAKRLAAEGAAVAVNYAGRRDKAEQVVADIQNAGGTAVALQGDVADAASVAAMFERFDQAFGPSLDILFANAGIYELQPVQDADVAHYDKTLDVNVRGVYLTVLQAAKRLADHGRVVITGSVIGDKVPFPGHAAYAMSKSAVQGLTRGWARDLGPRGITVNCVQPGPIRTDMNPHADDSPEATALRGFSSLGRYGEADEVAQAVLQLCLPESSFVTGTTLNVDGGIFI